MLFSLLQLFIRAPWRLVTGQLHSAAGKCCLWLVFQVELIAVQGLVGQGQRQATHNKHIPRRFTCSGQPAQLFYMVRV